MQRADAVYGVRSHKAEICHFNLPVRKDCVAVDNVPVVGIERPQLAAETLVDFLHDLINSWKQALEKTLRPFFESFRHNRVVGVRNDVRCDVPRLIPAVAVLVEKKTHKLGNTERRVRVVDVDCNSVRKVVKARIELQVTAQNGLNGRRNEEVLLFKAQRFAFDVVVGGIKHLIDGLRHSLCRTRLDIFAFAEHIHIEILRSLRLPKS